MINIKHFLSLLSAFVCMTLSACNAEDEINPNVNGRGHKDNEDKKEEPVVVTYDVYAVPGDGTQVPLSTNYSVSVSQQGESASSPVFQCTCPTFSLGYKNMVANDQWPLDRYKGYSISYTNFSFEGEVEVTVTVLDKTAVPLSSFVKILPSRKGVTASIKDNVITFKLTQPGQYSVEVGENGWKNGLMVFANPRETDVPKDIDESYYRIENATEATIKAIPAKYTGVYFKEGVHDIGVYTIPSTVKNVYIPGGAFIYGSLLMDANSSVRIYGRGVLSQAHLNYRQAHCIEATNGSNNITLEGITLSDINYFSVRLLGNNNKVDWAKVIGGWTYNCDGISAYAGSKITNCFIWANDDNIKCYETGTLFEDIVCWQLNNGGLIQLNWGNGKCDSATVRRVDVLHADWNKEEKNRGLLSCVGNKYYYERGGFYQQYSGWTKNILIEDVVTENAISLVYMLAPYNYSPLTVSGIRMKDWKIYYSNKYQNHLEGMDTDNHLQGLEFDNVSINGTVLTKDNYKSVLRLVMSNTDEPVFK